MKRILILGKNGYIATCFAKHLRDTEPEDRVLLLSTRDGHWKETDFSAYDCVFFAAGLAHVRETEKNASLYYRVNRDLAVEAAEKARRSGVRQFIYMSSLSVYGLRRGHIDDATPLRPVSHYGRSKRDAEQALTALSDPGFSVALVRAPMIYGPHCRGNYNLLRTMALRLPFFPATRNQRSFLYIEDLCAFLNALVRQETGGVFVPQSREPVSTDEMVQAIASANGRRIRILPGISVPARPLCHLSRAASSAFDSLTVSQDLGDIGCDYQQTSFLESITRTERGYGSDPEGIS